MKLSKYSLGFTTGSALIHESVIIAQYYTALKDWPAVRERVLEENSFQARTVSTLKKTYAEVAKRLRNLADAEIELLSQGDEYQVRKIAWIAICRQYLLIKEFSLEVIIPQYESARFLVTYEDYDAFFNKKAEWHRNLDEASKLTKAKARQVIFQMLKECNLIGGDNEIQHQQLDQQLKQIIIDNDSEDLGLFPGVG